MSSNKRSAIYSNNSHFNNSHKIHSNHQALTKDNSKSSKKKQTKEEALLLISNKTKPAASNKVSNTNTNQKISLLDVIISDDKQLSKRLFVSDTIVTLNKNEHNNKNNNNKSSKTNSPSNGQGITPTSFQSSSGKESNGTRQYACNNDKQNCSPTLESPFEKMKEEQLNCFSTTKTTTAEDAYGDDDDNASERSLEELGYTYDTIDDEDHIQQMQQHDDDGEIELDVQSFDSFSMIDESDRKCLKENGNDEDGDWILVSDE